MTASQQNTLIIPSRFCRTFEANASILLQNLEDLHFIDDFNVNNTSILTMMLISQ